MSLEQMIKQASIDVDAAVERQRKLAEQRNQYVQSQIGELTEVYEKLVSETDEDEIDRLEDRATCIAENLEIEFVYVRYDGQTRTYTPEAFWEPSGGCSWVESAQYGYDYGWNVR